MQIGHWIALGVPGAGSIWWLTVKLVRLFGRVTKLEELAEKNVIYHEKNDDDHERIERKQDVSLVALRELLVHEGLRKPGEGINGEDKKG